MKIIATIDSENCLVELTRQEVEAITGISYYSSDNTISGIFKEGKKPQLKVIEPVLAIGNIKGIPKEVRTLRQGVEKVLADLKEYEAGLKFLPVLSQKIVDD